LKSKEPEDSDEQREAKLGTTEADHAAEQPNTGTGQRSPGPVPVR